MNTIFNFKTVSTLVLGCLAIGLFSAAASAQPSIARMSTEGLHDRLDDPQVVVVDVRTQRDWTASALKIKGAVRLDIRSNLSVVEAYDKTKTLVFYCA